MFGEKSLVGEYDNTIEEILRGVYSTGHDLVQANLDYSESFRREGARKTQFVINRIAELDEATLGRLETFVAISIGGADGSDLLALVEKTSIKKAIMLEIDNAAAEFARIHTKPLIKRLGAWLEIVIGDAAQQLEAIICPNCQIMR
jgi:hypothetical protein